jgi:hypothetical protein
MPFQSGLGFVLICKNQLIKKIHQFIFDGIFILEKSGVLAANFFTHEKIFLQLGKRFRSLRTRTFLFSKKLPF